ncbi:MAG: hypothetical protein KC561_17065, partial [Myxococcales bacterium]|nr:hypothetical protein [Myxococcales bacterium]
ASIDRMDILAYVIASVFIANSAPHLAHGLAGRAFPTPFAKPPGIGLSNARTNLAWGLLNLAIGTALLLAIGDFRFGVNLETGVVALTCALVGMAIYHSAKRAKQRREN